MKFLMRKLMGAAALSLLGGTVQAATLSVVPSASAVNSGAIISVVIHVSDLVDSGAPSLGAFDLDIAFDASVLSYTGFGWGDSVNGDQLDLAGLGSLSGYDDAQAATGMLNFYEVSLDDSAALNDAQAGEFGLLTLNFAALNAGFSSLSLAINSLSDADGVELTDVLINNGSVTVNTVPVPATLPLFASALLLCIGRRRSHK